MTATLLTQTADSAQLGFVAKGPGWDFTGEHYKHFCINDESMATESIPLFPPGAVIIVNTQRTASIGDYVVAELNDGSHVVRKLVEVSGSQWLRAENPSYPDLQLIETVRIHRVCGWQCLTH